MRERLAAAALAIYRADGVEAVSFRRLAEAVGISHTLTYRYFDDKDALLARVRAHCFLHFDRHVRARERHVGQLGPHMDSIAKAYIDYACTHPAEYRLMFSIEQPAPDRYPELLAARRLLFDYAVTALERYVQAGTLVGDARTLLHTLWITLHGLMSLHVANQLIHGRSLQQLAQPLIQQALAQQTPPTAPKSAPKSAPRTVLKAAAPVAAAAPAKASARKTSPRRSRA